MYLIILVQFILNNNIKDTNEMINYIDSRVIPSFKETMFEHLNRNVKNILEGPKLVRTINQLYIVPSASLSINCTLLDDIWRHCKANALVHRQHRLEHIQDAKRRHLWNTWTNTSWTHFNWFPNSGYIKYSVCEKMLKTLSWICFVKHIFRCWLVAKYFLFRKE